MFPKVGIDRTCIPSSTPLSTPRRFYPDFLKIQIHCLIPSTVAVPSESDVRRHHQQSISPRDHITFRFNKGADIAGARSSRRNPAGFARHSSNQRLAWVVIRPSMNRLESDPYIHQHLLLYLCSTPWCTLLHASVIGLWSVRQDVETRYSFVVRSV